MPGVCQKPGETQIARNGKLLWNIQSVKTVGLNAASMCSYIDLKKDIKNDIRLGRGLIESTRGFAVIGKQI
jgi:hypothetical protein